MTMPVRAPAAPSSRDWTRQPPMILLWWGLPIVGGMLANAPRLSQRADAGVWAVAMGWMATGCLLNARRCHRVHCFISGPVLLLGALFAALSALGAIEPSAGMFGNIVNGALLLALLSFAPEIVWRRYV